MSFRLLPVITERATGNSQNDTITCTNEGHKNSKIGIRIADTFLAGVTIDMILLSFTRQKKNNISYKSASQFQWSKKGQKRVLRTELLRRGTLSNSNRGKSRAELFLVIGRSSGLLTSYTRRWGNELDRNRYLEEMHEFRGRTSWK